VSDTVAVEIDGKQHVGTYEVKGDLVIVTSADGRREATQVGGSPPDTIARTLLRELVRENP
jgi:hypothetical protein